VRAQYQQLSKGRLLLNVISAPLLPFLLFARAGAKVFSRGVYRMEFIRTSLQTFGGIGLWCAGEFSGYLGSLISPAPLLDESAQEDEDVSDSER
jgi:hypothetical protein